jgi:hypothetical protein
MIDAPRWSRQMCSNITLTPLTTIRNSARDPYHLRHLRHTGNLPTKLVKGGAASHDQD